MANVPGPVLPTAYSQAMQEMQEKLAASWTKLGVYSSRVLHADPILCFT